MSFQKGLHLSEGEGDVGSPEDDMDRQKVMLWNIYSVKFGNNIFSLKAIMKSKFALKKSHFVSFFEK